MNELTDGTDRFVQRDDRGRKWVHIENPGWYSCHRGIIPATNEHGRPHKKPDKASSYQGPSIHHTLFLAVTWIIKGLLRVGIPMGPMILLTVRGRKSGEPRTTPVDLFERGGRSFLVSTHRQESSNWVRNLRTAGEGVLTRGWSRRAITVVELPPDVAGQVLKEVLGPRPGIAGGRIRPLTHLSCTTRRPS